MLAAARRPGTVGVVHRLLTAARGPLGWTAAVAAVAGLAVTTFVAARQVPVTHPVAAPVPVVSATPRPAAAQAPAPALSSGVPEATRSPRPTAVPDSPAVADEVVWRAAPRRAAQLEYPLTFTAAGVNPKSAPLVLPNAPAAAAVPFPTADAQLAARPAAERPPAGGTVPRIGGAVTNAMVYALIQRYFPPQEWAAANAVSACESGQRNVVSAPNRNGSRDWGVFQLNDGGTLQGLLSQTGLPSGVFAPALDADWNVRAAAQLWRQRGWQPWVCAAKLGIVDGLYSSRRGPNG